MLRVSPFGVALIGLGVGVVTVAGAKVVQTQEQVNTPTGKLLKAMSETTVPVGSFPCASTLSPDGKFAIITNSGYREQLSVIRLSDKKLTDAKPFNKAVARKTESIYFGLCWNGDVLLVSRGVETKVSQFKLDAEGKLVSAGADIDFSEAAAPFKAPIAGIAVLSGHLFAAINGADPANKLKGGVVEVDLATGAVVKTHIVSGYPYALCTVGDQILVGSERDSVVEVLTSAGVQKSISTGTKPVNFTIAGDRVLVVNAESDTLTILRKSDLGVEKTVLLRPAEVGVLPAATPMGVTHDGKGTAYVALADMNAVAVVDLAAGALVGYMPTGWYPTSVQYDAAGKGLIVSNAKGSVARNPNGKPVGKLGQYGPNIIEGTTEYLPLAQIAPKLESMTESVLALNHFNPMVKADWEKNFINPGIKHVIYIVKENRTYDQVFGDISTGNGDASLTLFPREVTPNQHALAERFVLLDNFHVCAEVSYDGWAWSTQAFANEYVERNAFNNYSRRRQGYDTEGQNGGINPDYSGVPDIARGPGGYIWESVQRKGRTVRNYGMLVGDVEELGAKSDAKKDKLNGAMKKALAGSTDINFRNYDLNYADSDLWVRYGVSAEKQIKSYGQFGATSRFAEWKREFDAFEKKGELPALSMLRLPRDHTSGSAAGQFSARAMVADNDYAVGSVVDALSKSKFWKDTVICVVEDDAQAGYDHVDCHRSLALVISPFIEKGTKHSAFYNTCSMLRTIGLILGTDPLNAYDGFARPINVFGKSASNASPFTAIMPSKAIATEINTPLAYRAGDSARLINRFQEESISDVELNDILWGSIKGANSPRPRVVNRRKSDND